MNEAHSLKGNRINLRVKEWPIRYCTFSWVNSISLSFAFSMSSAEPRRRTLSLLDVDDGNRIMIPPQSSEMARMNWPLASFSEAWSECGISIVSSFIPAWIKITLLQQLLQHWQRNCTLIWPNFLIPYHTCGLMGFQTFPLDISHSLVTNPVTGQSSNVNSTSI